MAEEKPQDQELDYQINVGNINNGAIPEIFAKLHQQAMENIRDVNTSEKSKRSINIKITYAPTPDRKAAMTIIDTTTKLAPHKIEPSLIHISRIKGKVVSFVHDPAQDELFHEKAAGGTQ